MLMGRHGVMRQWDKPVLLQLSLWWYRQGEKERPELQDSSYGTWVLRKDLAIPGL